MFLLKKVVHKTILKVYTKIEYMTSVYPSVFGHGQYTYKEVYCMATCLTGRTSFTRFITSTMIAAQSAASYANTEYLSFHFKYNRSSKQPCKIVASLLIRPKKNSSLVMKELLITSNNFKHQYHTNMFRSFCDPSKYIIVSKRRNRETFNKIIDEWECFRESSSDTQEQSSFSYWCGCSSNPPKNYDELYSYERGVSLLLENWDIKKITHLRFVKVTSEYAFVSAIAMANNGSVNQVSANWWPHVSKFAKIFALDNSED